MLLVSLAWLGLPLWFTEGSVGAALGHHEQCSDNANGSDKDPDEQDASADDGFLTHRPVQSVGDVQYRSGNVISSAVGRSLRQQLVLRSSHFIVGTRTEDVRVHEREVDVCMVADPSKAFLDTLHF